MPLLPIPVRQWKAMEVLVSVWCQWKALISEHIWCMKQRLFASYHTQSSSDWSEVAQHFGSSIFWEQTLLPSTTQVPLAWPAQAQVPVLITAAAIMFNMEGGHSHQMSPVGSPWRHQACHLCHSTSLILPNICLLHMLPFVRYFSLQSAPTSEFSITNIVVALHLHFKMKAFSCLGSCWGMR